AADRNGQRPGRAKSFRDSDGSSRRPPARSASGSRPCGTGSSVFESYGAKRTIIVSPQETLPMLTRRSLFPALAALVLTTFVATAAGTLPTPEQFAGHRIGADNKLVRWDKIVEYMKLAAASSDRVRFRELGKSSNGNPFIVLEISS